MRESTDVLLEVGEAAGSRRGIGRFLQQLADLLQKLAGLDLSLDHVLSGPEFEPFANIGVIGALARRPHFGHRVLHE